MQRVIAAVLPLFILSGCIEMRHFSRGEPTLHEKQQFIKRQAPLSFFAYDKTLPRPMLIEERILETERYQSFFLTMPSSGPNSQKRNLASGRYLKNKSPGKKKLIVILPIYGSSTYPPEIMSLRFTEWNARDDTNVLLILGENDPYNIEMLAEAKTEAELLDAAGQSAEKIKNSIIDVMRFLDWAELQPEIDQKLIGIIGFSFGAMIASIVTGVDQRVRCGAFIMGGAHLHEVLAFSDAQFLKETQKKIIRRFGWTREILADKLKRVLETVNPANYAAGSRKSADCILIVESSRDNYIPQKARDDFWRAWQKPERIVLLSSSHKKAFLAMTLLNFNSLDRKIVKFFERNF